MGNSSIVLPIVFAVAIISLLSSTDDAYAASQTIDINPGAGSTVCVSNDNCYTPMYKIVTQYDTVTWNNFDGQAHTATSGEPQANPGESGTYDGRWNTGSIAGITGISSPVLMDTPGIFNYFCQFHPWQTGTIEVQPFTNDISIPVNSGAPGVPDPMNDCTAQGPNACYDPDFLSVIQGELITWTNNDVMDSHTATADDGSFDTGTLTPGMTSGITDTATLDVGVYPYHCNFHPWQVGTLEVTTPAESASIVMEPGSGLGAPSPAANCSDGGNDACFNPGLITVLQGTVIGVSNRDSGVTHTLTSFTPGLFDTGDVSGIDGTSRYSSIDTSMISTGIYSYQCIYHPWATGAIIVIDQLNSDPIPEKIQKGPVTVDLELFVGGLTSPVHLTHFGTDDVYIVDQPGQIWRVDDLGNMDMTPFLDISMSVYMPGLGAQDAFDFDERGLLGLAFHPDFALSMAPNSGKFYTYSSVAYDPMPTGGITFPTQGIGIPDHQSIIQEWKVQLPLGDPPVLDTINPPKEIMRVDQPQFNHNGGMIEFGPDGFLYITFGDGGGANDIGDGHGTGNGQDQTTILGMIVRIDPTCDDGMSAPSSNGQYCIPASNPNVGSMTEVEEMFTYGMRNNWKFSWDSMSGAMYGADVGQNQIEEINQLFIDGNYGWSLREGTFGFDPLTGFIDTSSTPMGMNDPIVQYDHDEGTSVTGGYVYRGAVVTDLVGKYVFGDFSRDFSGPGGRVFYIDDIGMSNNLFELNIPNPPIEYGQGKYIKSFGQDNSGELYLLGGDSFGPFVPNDGKVFKIIPDSGGSGGIGSTQGQVDILAADTCGISFVSGNPIDYGALVPGQESGLKTLVLDNTGNVFATLLVRGGDWVDGMSTTQMSVSDTHYDLSGMNSYAMMTPLSSTDSTVLSAMFDPNNNLPMFWQLLANIIGSFQGSLTQTVDFTVSC